jgi:hypothetical protein
MPPSPPSVSSARPRSNAAFASATWAWREGRGQLSRSKGEGSAEPVQNAPDPKRVLQLLEGAGWIGW